MTYYGMLQSKSMQVSEAPSHFFAIICHFWSHMGKRHVAGEYFIHYCLEMAFIICLKQSLVAVDQNSVPAPQHTHSLMWVLALGSEHNGK